MKQLIQYIRSGESRVADVPAPSLRSGQVLMQVAASLISAGTERMVVEFAQKSLIEKARLRPDLVRQTLDKVKREGILTTLEAVQNRLDQPMALGYACAGRVIDVASDVSEFQVGDPVACAGGGYAVHAEVVGVPKNLVVKLPEGVDFESAAFTTLGAIALQGIRLSEVKLGEITVVIGLGLLGQLTVQMLKAAGCIVFGMDLQRERAELAYRLGVDAATTSPDELKSLVLSRSSGHGADVVLITADTRSNQPVELAGEVARNKGTVVAVGAIGMTIPRKVYYEKELDFRISRSYGPGRYDPEYEEKGHDYPYGYVRWTQQRNMQAFAQLLAAGKVRVQPLITHRFSIDDATRAYELITGKSSEPFLGVVLTYPETPDLGQTIVVRAAERAAQPPIDQASAPARLDRVRLGIIGAGNFANATLLPAIKTLSGLELVGIASSGGLSARSAADRFGFTYCTTDDQAILEDNRINTVAILTRHHDHARQVVAALNAGKHVFVEKPLCLTEEELSEIVQVYSVLPGGDDVTARAAPSVPSSPYLMVGFNRRFAPFVQELKQHVQRLREPLMLCYRVNAGYISPEHWTQDPQQSGGRLLGEACHFIDLLIYLSGSEPARVTTQALPDSGHYSKDNLLVTMEFTDGSLGTVTYVANGDKAFGKECLEVFGGGLSARLEDYRTLIIYHGGHRVKRVARLRQDKGHQAELQALVAYLTGGGPQPISFDDIVRSTRATLAAQRSLLSGEPVTLIDEHS